MQNRMPTYPGRVKLTPVQGQENTYDMERADQPTQVGTPLNKASLLKDSTAALYGLGTDAVPDDVLAYVGKYNQHWWQRYLISYKAVVSSSHILGYKLVTGTSKSATISVEYGDSVKANASGNIVIENKQTVSVSWNTYNNFSVVFGKYFKDPNNNKVYKWVSKTNFDCGDLSGEYYLYLYYVDEVFSFKEYTKDALVQSSSKSAYPESGEKNGYYYQYLGIPFDNAATAPKIATGSYVGTGTYGSSNPNSLTFGFKPKWILVYQRVNKSNNVPNNLLNTSGKPYINCEYLGTQFGVSSAYYQGIRIADNSATGDDQAIKSEDGKTISWRSTSADFQANTSGYRYDYLAIG